MKFARWLLISLGVIVVLAGALCGVALLPSVQRWAVLKATADVPGLKLDVAGVKAGFSGVTLQQVQAEQHRVTIKLERLEADFSPLSFLFGSRLEITRLVATGLDIDASRLSGANTGAAAAGAPAATPGVLASARLPFDLALDNVRIEGSAKIANAANQPPLAARFVVTGGKISAGHEGRLQLDATVDNPTPDAPVATLRAQVGLRATLTAQRTFSKISLTTVVDAAGTGLSGGSQLKLGAELFRSSAGENYEVTVDTVMQGARENLLKFQAQLPAAGRQYAGDWELKMRTAQVEPFLLGRALPTFDVKGGGRFAFATDGTAASIQGGVQAQLSRLEAINPDWRALGPIKLDAAFDGGQQDGVLQLTVLKANVSGATPLVEARTTAPIRYDVRRRQLLTTGQGADSLLHVALTGVPVDWVRLFVTGLDISGGVITGEFDLSPLGDSATAASARGRLQATEVTLIQEGRPLLTRASVAVRTEATVSDASVDASVLELTIGTPEGDALKVEGKLSQGLAPNPPTTFAGRFTASSNRLFSRWLPGAPVKAQGEVGLTLRGSLLELEPGSVQLVQANQAIFDATILQSARLDLDSHAVKPRDPALPVAKVVLGRLPLALLPVTEPGAALGGFIEQGEFEVSVRGSRTLLRALSPLRLADVSLTQDGRLAATGLAIEASPQIEYGGPEDYRGQSGDVVIRSAKAGNLLTLKAEASAAPGQGSQANATFAVEVPALASQPWFVDVSPLSAGKATGEIRAARGATQQIEARMTLNGLVAADTNLTLPVANIGFRAVMQPSGAGSIQVPVLLDNGGRRSDLNIALALSPLGKGYSVDGKVTGQQIDWEGMQALLGAFVPAAAPDGGDRPVPAAGGVTPDTVAAWSRFSGQIVLDIKSVTRGKDWAMTDLAGTLAIEPTVLSLPKLTAAFGETSRLNAKMELRFTGGPMPYRLTGDYALNDFDVGRLFKAFDANRPPTVEGLFNISSSFSGNGETIERAIDRAHGGFQLTSHQGIFRGLQRSADKVSMATKAVDLISSMLSNKVGKAAEKVAGGAVYVDQLAQSLAEIKYDQFSVRLTRDELLNLNFEDISLVAADLRLIGRAEVAYVPGKTIFEQPLSAALNLAARDKIEEQLGKLHLLSGAKDDLGYAKAKYVVSVGGTLGKPDPTSFFTKIAADKLSELIESGN
jgi:hypothetical protein